jgi:putative ABC transport system permease protein
MLPNILKTGWRHLARRRLYALINVAGLAVGIASFLLVGLFVHHELSHDRHFPDHDRIYRVVMDRPITADERERRIILPEMIGPDLVEWSSEVDATTRVAAGSYTVHLQVGDRQVRVENMISADPSFFRVLPVTPLAGDVERALDEPGSVVLTATVARALFGDVDAVGEMVYYAGDRENGLTVSAVVPDPTRATHLPYDAVLPRQQGDDARWNYYHVRTYVRLAAGASRERVEEQLPRFVQQHMHFDYPIDEELAAKHALWLQPLTDIHLDGDITAAATTTTPARYVQIFSLVALLLLAIACINYVNLATAYATERAREVGMRRTLGATRRQLGAQFLTESVMVALLALPLALVTMTLALPRFTEITGIPLLAGDLLAPGFLMAGAAVAGAVGLLSGIYPSFVLARFSPRRSLADESGGRGRGATLRQALVVTQFAVSAGLIICALTISRQMDLVREARLGGVDEQVVMLFAGGSPGEKDALKEAVLASGDVVAASFGPAPNTTSHSTTYSDSEGQTDVTIRSFGADADYLATLGLELAAGEALTETTSVAQGAPVLLNETAMRQLGAELGQHHPRFDLTPVGVVRDYHFVPLHEPISALRIDLATYNWHPLLVRLEEGRVASGLEHLQRAWTELRPDRPFEYRFLDQELDRSYRAEIRMGALLRSITTITLFLASLGLFGLAAFAAQQRAKEIGIRKVLGASVASIVALLSRQFVVLVLLALALAALPTYLLMQRWLEDFAYRVELGPGLFALTAAIAVAVAVLTVGYHAVRAATADPVRVLRSE